MGDLYLLYAIVFSGLVLVLVAALLIPAPARPPANEAGAHLALLGLGSAAAIVTGVLALADRPVPSAICGAGAWLLAMPCVWMARAPRPADGSWHAQEDDDDDDGGGSPWPSRPSAPPAADDRLGGLRPAALADVRGGRLALPEPAPALALAAAQAPAEPVAPGTARRRLQRPPRVRGDHGSIVFHAGACRPGRRRRGGLGRRVLRRWRGWLGVGPLRD